MTTHVHIIIMDKTSELDSRRIIRICILCKNNDGDCVCDYDGLDQRQETMSCNLSNQQQTRNEAKRHAALGPPAHVELCSSKQYRGQAENQATQANQQGGEQRAPQGAMRQHRRQRALSGRPKTKSLHPPTRQTQGAKSAPPHQEPPTKGPRAEEGATTCGGVPAAVRRGHSV